MSFNSGTFFLFCVQHHIPPFHLVSHGCVHEQNTVAFYFTNYYNKEDALDFGYGEESEDEEDLEL